MLRYHNLVSLYKVEGNVGNRVYLTSILVALEILFAFSYVGYIPLPNISITTMHIMVIVAAMVLGPFEGGVVGLIFGLTSIWKAEVSGTLYTDIIFSPFRSGNPWGSLVMALGSRIVFGVLAGVLFGILFRYGSSKIRGCMVVVISVAATFLHSLLVYGFMGLFFPENHFSWRNAFTDIGTINGIVMWVLTGLIVYGIYRVCSGERALQLYAEYMAYCRFRRGTTFLWFWGIMAAAILLLGALFLHMNTRLDIIFAMEEVSLAPSAQWRFMSILLQFLCALTAILYIGGTCFLWAHLYNMQIAKKAIALEGEVEVERRVNQQKTNFLSTVSHDIYTPMNAIIGMTAIASQHAEEPERVRECLHKITFSSQHLLGLINEVLDMSKIESGTTSLTREGFSLSYMLERLTAIVQPQAQAKKQQLDVRIGRLKHEEVIGDMLRLQQVLLGLLGNAIKFTPQGGKIALDVREQDFFMEGKKCYKFVVSDNGIGMSKEFIGRIFEPFANEEDTGSGKAEDAGLGMVLIRNIVRMMNGDIKVESQLGQGSMITVTVCLELAEEKGEAEKLENLTALVVEGDKLGCESTCELLESMGIRAGYAVSGAEAVSKMEEREREGRPYSVILLDWKLPQEDGLGIAGEIRKRFDKQTAILLTAYDWSEIGKENGTVDVDGWVSKPLFQSKLDCAIRKAFFGENCSKKEKVPAMKKLIEKNYVGKKVLLVDDNWLNLEIEEEIIKMTGAEVEKAYNGQEAVEKILASPESHYDIVLMDIRMPVMDGYEAAQKIRKSERADLQKLPIVAITADAVLESALRAESVGMNGYITTPIDLNKLEQCLEQWMV